MAGYCSTGQSPQRAVVLMEEEDDDDDDVQYRFTLIYIFSGFPASITLS
jgi:hypothetical protein